MPWLPLSVRDVLKQDLGGGSGGDDEYAEIIVGDDCSTDGSLAFLVGLALELGEKGSVERYLGDSAEDGTTRKTVPLTGGEAMALAERRGSFASPPRSRNPALLLRPRRVKLSRRASDAVPWEEADKPERPLRPVEVAAAAHPKNLLRVIVMDEDVNCGMGGVMTRCLRVSRGRFISHMESDDERPSGAFCTLLNALRRRPEWDGVTSLTKCIGWDSGGMERYVGWQNEQDTPDKMRLSRFVEIPSLLQTALFRRRAVHVALEENGGRFRDDRMWAADMHFWLSFFDRGLTVGKVRQELFHWRQHPGQQTRNHGRLSIANLRKCKCSFLINERGFLWKDSRGRDRGHSSVVVEIWGTGNTLSGWSDDLRALLDRIHKDATVVAVNWKPGQEVPARAICEGTRHIRLFAFGMEKARRRVQTQLDHDWDEDFDIFVS